MTPEQFQAWVMAGLTLVNLLLTGLNIWISRRSQRNPLDLEFHKRRMDVTIEAMRALSSAYCAATGLKGTVEQHHCEGAVRSQLQKSLDAMEVVFTQYGLIAPFLQMFAFQAMLRFRTSVIALNGWVLSHLPEAKPDDAFQHICREFNDSWVALMIAASRSVGGPASAEALGRFLDNADTLAPNPDSTDQ